MNATASGHPHPPTPNLHLSRREATEDAYVLNTLIQHVVFLGVPDRGRRRARWSTVAAALGTECSRTENELANLAAGCPLLTLDRKDDAIWLEPPRHAMRLEPSGPRVHKDRAAEFAAKGKLDAALREFQLALESAPSDLVIHQKVAELLRKLGRTDEAAVEYRAVSMAYAARGLLHKAVAMQKLVLELVPGNLSDEVDLAMLEGKLSQPQEGDAVGRWIQSVTPRTKMPDEGRPQEADVEIQVELEWAGEPEAWMDELTPVPLGQGTEEHAVQPGDLPRHMPLRTPWARRALLALALEDASEMDAA